MSYTSELEHWRIEAKAYYDHVEEKHIISDPARGIRPQPIIKRWEVKRLLGRGGFGEVRLEKHGDNERAVKRIGTTGEQLKDAEYVRELKALLEFSKPKYKAAGVFVEFYGWFTNGPDVFLAMEYIALGDLDKNLKSGTLGEPEAKEIGHQILTGLNIMHLESFAHRDLKPQNVLVVSGPPNWWVKLADFGLSKRLNNGTALYTRTGTMAYMAPEVQGFWEADSSAYSNAVDLWAFGCIMYRLVAGVVPFPQSRLLIDYCDGKVLFPEDALSEVTVKGARFIKHLLQANPKNRLTASEALQHPWVSGVEISKRLSLTLQQPAPTETYPTMSYTSEQGYNTVSHAAFRSFQYSEQSNSSLSNTNVSPQEETLAESKDTIPSSLPSPQNSGHINKEAYYTANPILRKPINPSTEYHASTNEPVPANTTTRIAPPGLDKGSVNIKAPSVESSANPPAPATQMPIVSAIPLRKAVPESLAKTEIDALGWDSLSTANKKSKNAIEDRVQLERAKDHQMEPNDDDFARVSFGNKRNKKEATDAVEEVAKIGTDRGWDAFTARNQDKRENTSSPVQARMIPSVARRKSNSGNLKELASSSKIVTKPGQAYATYEHEGIADDGELSFPHGAIISNIKFLNGKPNWLSGKYGRRTGIFPASYVKLHEDIPNNNVDTDPAFADTIRISPRISEPTSNTTSTNWVWGSTIWDLATTEQIAEIFENEEWADVLRENQEQLGKPRAFTYFPKHSELTLWDVATKQQKSHCLGIRELDSRERAMWRSVMANTGQVRHRGKFLEVIDSQGKGVLGGSRLGAPGGDVTRKRNVKANVQPMNNNNTILGSSNHERNGPTRVRNAYGNPVEHDLDSRYGQAYGAARPLENSKSGFRAFFKRIIN